jgi:calcyclin binding protein
VNLNKDEKKTWNDIAYKESTLGSDLKETDDPGASLMTMMKQIYETGDETMKQTIAKAWTETQRKHI